MKFIIEQNLLQTTVNYLGSKPYAEVVGLLAELTRLQKYEPSFTKPEDKDLQGSESAQH